MADKKISELTAITGADTAADDYFIVVDTSGSATKKISRAELNNAIEQDVLSSIEITDITNNVNIEGTVTADGLTVDVTSTVGQTLHNSTGTSVYTRYQNNSGNDNYIGYTGNSFEVFPNNTKALAVASGGDVSLYDSTGVTQGFYWDASTQRLGLGDTAPDALLHLSDDTPVLRLTNPQTSSSLNLSMGKIEWETLDASAPGVISYIDVVDSNNFGTTFDMAFATGQSGSATERMRIDSLGNVGIGTTSPALNINANSKALSIYQNTSDGAGLGLVSSNCTLNIVAGNNASYFSNETSDPMIFRTNATERMRIDSSGNVGIGTSSPSGKAEIYKSSVNSAIIGTSYNGHYFESQSDDATDGFEIYQKHGSTTTRNSFIVNDNRTGSKSAAFLVRGDGNVGIGTSSPDRSLHIAGSEPTVVLENTGQGTDLKTWRMYSNSSSLQIGTVDDAFASGQNALEIGRDNTDNITSIQFKTGASSERMRIDSSGNLLVANTTGSISTVGAAITYYGTVQSATNTGDYSIFNKTTSSTGKQIEFRSVNVTVGDITSTSSSTSYNTSSDYRLKENITDAADAGDKIDAIQVRQFDWIADGTHQDYGMIAQELITVAPEAVSGDPDSDEMMGVDYSKLVPMLVKEIQQLRSRVAALEAN